MNQIFNLRIIPFSKEILELQNYITKIKSPSSSLSHDFSSYINQQLKSLALIQSIQFIHDNKFQKSIYSLQLATQDQYRKLKTISKQFHVEDLKIEALQGALDDYKNIIKKYSELQALVERKRKKSLNFFEDSEKYLVEIQEIKKNIKELEKEVLSVKDNLKMGKMWFRAERDEKFEMVLAEIFGVYSEKMQKEKDFWLNLKYEG